MKFVNFLISSVLVLALSGCASIAGDNNRKVSVNSKPAGAGVYVDNNRVGTTPAIITLPNDIYGGKTVTVKKDGFHSETQVINTKFQPVALLDILFWPTFLVDGVTGNMVKIDPATTNLDYDLHRVA